MKMYYCYNINTNEKRMAMGRTFMDACRRAGLDPNVWDYDLVDYED